MWTAVEIKSHVNVMEEWKWKKSNNYYPTVKRQVKIMSALASVFSSLFISEDYSSAHSYTLQET